MAYSDLAALVLAVATLVVAVILPSLGYFAFILARRDAIEAAKSAARSEMKPDGEVFAAVRDEVLTTINDENGSLKLYLAELVNAEIERKLALSRPVDEYGDPIEKGGT